MDRIFHFFVSRPLLAGIFTTTTVALGLVVISMARLSEYPNIQTGHSEISTKYPGASPEDVETNLTNKIERELLSVFEIKQFSSNSSSGHSHIVVEFKSDADLDDANQHLREAVGRVTDVPPEVTDAPMIFEEKTSTTQFMTVGISGDLSYDDLHAYARQFEKKLRRISGVGRISAIGLNQREIQVQLNPERVSQFGLTPAEVATAIKARHLASTGGTLESYSDERNIVVMSELQSVDDVKEVIVRPSETGPLIRIRDLGTVKNGFERQREAIRINGKPVIAFDVRSSTKGDVNTGASTIKRLIADEEERMSGAVEFDIGYDLSVDVRNRFSMVSRNGLLGLLLVLIVLGASLSIRTAFWVAMSIPVSLLGATIFLVPIAGGLDSVSLGSLILVVGIVVDDSIVVSEAIQSQLEKGIDLFEAATSGLKEVFMPVLTGMLTTATVFIPFFFLPGTVGKVAFVIPLTVLLALSVSLVECFLVLPAHIIHGAQKMKARARGRTPIFLEHYQAVLSYFLRFRYVAAGTSIILLVLAGGWIVRNLDFIMFPIEAGRLVEIEVDLDPGFSIKASEALNRKIENRLEALPSDEVMSWTARVSPSNIDYVLSLNHLNERKRSVTEIVEELRGDITAVKGLRSVTFEIKAGGPEVGLPIAVRITDGSDAVRTKVADDLVEFLGTLPGVHDVSRDDTQGKGEVSLELDYIWLARHGLTVADIAQTLRIAHEGEIVSTTWFGDERIDIRVNLTKEFRTEDYLLSLKVQKSSGELVPFRAFAHLEKQPGVSGRRHWNAVRSITVSSDLDFDLNTPGAIDDAVSSWFDQSTYLGVAISTGGQIEESEEALQGLAVALIAALLAIYFLLGVLFNSLKQPVLILSVVPFGLLGVGTALSVHGQPLSFTGAIGAIGLIGVIVNGAIVMIHRINRLKMEMPGETPRNIVVAAASDRLRPVVLTVVTTAAGMIPLAYGIGGVDVFMGPMALSLGFGLLLSSPVILLLLPCFYVIMDDLAARAA